MCNELTLSFGQWTDKGRKEINQDFHGGCVPKGAQLTMKGAAFAMADGVSSSSVSQVASETAVKSFLEDYFCTSDAWTVQHAAQRVLRATNSWLYAEGQRSVYRYDKEKGYVCTFSAVVFKSDIAHILHVGDTRVYRLRDGALEQLTHDHRLWVSQSQSYLSRALGFREHIEIDYQPLRLRLGDIFIMATDGVYEYCDAHTLIEALQEPDDLDAIAKRMVDHALEQGSKDNLTLQIIRVEALPCDVDSLFQQQVETLPLPPILQAGAEFDGYQILRCLQTSSRSHVYLAVDIASNTKVIIKTPATDQQGDPAYLERLLMEEWIARRINSLHVAKAAQFERPRRYLYTVSEYIEGRTLSQWLRDHPRPDLETVRGIVEQAAKGLMAFHRMDMLHQDLKPDNLMIDASGVVKIIDFGSTRVGGVAENDQGLRQPNLLGAALYAAPEYFLGEVGASGSDLYSLGVLTYHLLSGEFPYGADVAKTRTAGAQKRLTYKSVLSEDKDIPAWIDATLKKAVHPNPHKRYTEISEFLHDLHHPNPAYLNQTRPPILERNPVMFWQGVSLALLIALILHATMG
ncbi:bifunctional protein-serine/threonine kinase/phosphatase [Hahella sp. CR1]|uniref:bifunctional protein-serine/threonine kinase/phosphatase n=1 Tax=Hahella sp. CR1 TaxID=2992807 RepID=UPI0024418607|nr:bifunctional protein-serine/threonine kinase/phosphatase [Hahella sp. CR1]MDG9669274.1 bifunctional protein-serine/threonine kinase/phosphatase [Hahella sp. CR1]